MSRNLTTYSSLTLTDTQNVKRPQNPSQASFVSPSILSMVPSILSYEFAHALSYPEKLYTHNIKLLLNAEVSNKCRTQSIVRVPATRWIHRQCLLSLGNQVSLCLFTIFSYCNHFGPRSLQLNRPTYAPASRTVSE